MKIIKRKAVAVLPVEVHDWWLFNVAIPSQLHNTKNKMIGL